MVENDGDIYEIEVKKDGNVTRYYKNGVLHSDIGPAVIHKSGEMEWWFNGVCRGFIEF